MEKNLSHPVCSQCEKVWHTTSPLLTSVCTWCEKSVSPEVKTLFLVLQSKNKNWLNYLFGPISKWYPHIFDFHFVLNFVWLRHCSYLVLVQWYLIFSYLVVENIWFWFDDLDVNVINVEIWLFDHFKYKI